jgi:hypothetical protein
VAVDGQGGVEPQVDDAAEGVALLLEGGQGDEAGQGDGGGVIELFKGA